MNDSETETEKERKDRILKELEGKNIAHYSVMLSSYISSRTEPNKAIFTFSIAAIGLLLASYEKLASSNCTISVLYSLSMAGFLVAVLSTLFIYVAHTKAIESYIRNESEKQRDFILKKWAYINYTAFGLGVTFSSVLGIFKVYG